MFMNNLYKKFAKEIGKFSQIDDSLAIGVSGGSDSMALVILAYEWAKNNNIKIVAITIDHGLRKESVTEALKVGKWLKKYNIQHVIIKWEGLKPPSNIQANARIARYRLMQKYCQEHNIKSLAIAHTIDDVAENFLIRLIRGSGLDGLTGINSENNLFGIRLIRPCLTFYRAELREYLKEIRQEWVEDSSNQNDKFARVKVRKLIGSFAEPEILTQRLANTAIHMSRAKNYIEIKLAESLRGIFVFHKEGFYTIDSKKFALLHEEEQLRSLATCLQYLGGRDYKPRFVNLLDLKNKIVEGRLTSGCTLWGCEISQSKKQREENILYLYRELKACGEDIKVRENQVIEWDGRFLCNIGDIKMDNLSIGALRKEGANTIKINNKLTKKIIYTFPALKRLEKIIAVPHIGYYSNTEIKNSIDLVIKNPPIFFDKDEINEKR